MSYPLLEYTPAIDDVHPQPGTTMLAVYDGGMINTRREGVTFLMNGDGEPTLLRFPTGDNDWPTLAGLKCYIHCRLRLAEDVRISTVFYRCPNEYRKHNLVELSSDEIFRVMIPVHHQYQDRRRPNPMELCITTRPAMPSERSAPRLTAT